MSEAKSSLITSSAPDGGWGWVIMFASFFIHVIGKIVIIVIFIQNYVENSLPSVIGTANTFGIFFNGLIDAFETSYSSTSLVSSVQMGVSFCIGPITSHLVNKYGCRRIIVAGSLVAATGLVTSGMAQNIDTLYISAGLCTGNFFLTSELMQYIVYMINSVKVWDLALSIYQPLWLSQCTSTKSEHLPVV